jgi:hypothetical protein
MSETRFDKIQKAMFETPEKAKNMLSDKDLEIKIRYEKAFTFWLNNPELDDRQVARFLINECNVSKSVAYEDLKKIKILLGNVKVAAKEWHRHMVIQMSLEAYRMAKAKKDPKSMVLAADKIGKYTKLDKDEAEALPWDQLLPPNFEPDPDIALLNLKPVENIEAKRKQLRDKYLRKYNPKHIEEAVIIEDDDHTEDSEDS